MSMTYAALDVLKPKAADVPRVSVITLFLNGEAFLADAIESVIAQSFTDWEFFLVDDGSGPAATAIAKEYASRFPGKVRYLDHPNHENRGMSATRNLGIRHARGELTAFIDADDIWLPGKLNEHVALLDRHPEVGMVCGTTVYWYSWSGGQDNVVPTGERQDVVIYPPEAGLVCFPLGPASPPSMSDIVLRSDLVRRLGGFEEQFTGHYESRVFLSKVFLTTPVYFSSKPSNNYRQHPASCVATALRDGTHVKNKELFLNWLEQYLGTMEEVDRRIVLSVRRELFPYRHPRLYYLTLLPTKIRNRLRRIAGRAARLIRVKAS
jgi:glycosyltransferase involved in cell wall biosynthesis